MQDEINEKVVVLVINIGKKGIRLSASMLKTAMQKYLQFLKKQEALDQQQAETYQPEGKQTMKDLMRQNSKLTNIEVTDRNIRDFEKTARKYNIDFALKKDKLSEKPRYLVFFKARDVDVMMAAFKEYSEYTTKEKEPSVKKKLTVAMKRSAPQKAREREKKKERTTSR